MRPVWGAARPWLVVAAFLAASVYSVMCFRVNASLSALLPPAEREVSQLAQHVVDSSLSNTMVLSVGPRTGGNADDSTEAREVARLLAASLATDPAVRWVRAGPSGEFEPALHEAYFARRLQFVTDAPDTLSRAWVEQRIARLERDLSGVWGTLIRPFAPADPLGAYVERLTQLEALRSTTLGIVEGQFVAADGHALVLVGLSVSALDGRAQAALLARLRTAFAAARAKGSQLVLELSGVNVFAVDTEARVERDISRILLVSVAAIVLLFLFVFRSLYGLLLALVPLGAGIAIATAACLLVWGEIHALTLAFGAALLGVAVDYPVHAMNHRGLSGQDRVEAPYRTALGLSAATTIVGFGALALSGFFVMRQIAVFAAVGLLSALLVTLWLLPALPNPRKPEFRRRLGLAASRALERVCSFPKLVGASTTLLLLLAWVALTGAQWQRSLEGLAPMNPELRTEDARVRQRTGAPATGAFALIVGANDEEALQRNDRAFHELERARREGLVGPFQSLHHALWSSELQRQNYDAVRTPEMSSLVKEGLQAEGFDTNAFAPYFEALAQAEFRPLTLDDLRRSPLAPLVEPFALSEPTRTLLLAYVTPTSDHARRELERRLAPLEGVHWVEQRRLLDDAYVALRERVRWALLGAGLAMCLMVAVRFRERARILAATVPALGAPVAALGTVAWLGQELSLFHLLAALVVLSMALDYGIFAGQSLRGGQASSGVEGPTVLSICLAALTTCASFGLLAFSSIPVLHGMGLTVAIGVGAALALVPLGLLLAGRAHPEHPSGPSLLESPRA